MKKLPARFHLRTVSVKNRLTELWGNSVSGDPNELGTELF